MSPRIKAYLMLLVVAVIWGVASPVIKFTLEGFHADLFLTYRFGVSTLVAIIIFLIGGFHLSKDIGTILLVLLYGFLNSVVSLGFLFFGMENTTVLEAGLITLVTPLLVSTAGVYFLHEHVTRREKIGMIIAVLGTLLTIIGPVLMGTNGAKFSGNILILGYVVSTLATTLIVKKLLKKGLSPLMLTNISFIIGFIAFLGYMISKTPIEVVISQIVNTETKYHLGVLYMAVISGTLAFYLSNRAQKTIEIGEASLFGYLYPLFSLPLAVIWLGEKITSLHILGGIIIVTGVVTAELKRSALAELKKKRYNSSSETKIK